MWKSVEMPVGGAIIAFGVSAAICYVATRVSLNGEFYDIPGGRKTHSGPVPHLGGIAIATSLAVVLAFSGFRWPVFLYGLGFLLLGSIDDIGKIDYRVKLALQTLMAVLFAATQDPEVSIFGATLNPVMGAILETIWIVALVNAFNFIDGLNGLAGSVAAVAAVILGLREHEPFFFYLFAALVGFLVFNLKRGKIFLGDAGSYFLGFVLAASSIELYNGELVKSTVFMGYPAYEIIFVVFRRILRGNSPFQADRLHTHYTLEDGGIPTGIVVLILVVYSGLCNLFSLLQPIFSFVVYSLVSVCLLIVVVRKGRFQRRYRHL